MRCADVGDDRVGDFSFKGVGSVIEVGDTPRLKGSAAGDLVAADLLLHALPGAMEVTLDGALRHAQMSGDVLNRPVLLMEEKDNLALLRVERVQGDSEQLAHMLAVPPCQSPTFSES
jgi:hypothetical protein